MKSAELCTDGRLNPDWVFEMLNDKISSPQLHIDTGVLAQSESSSVGSKHGWFGSCFEGRLPRETRRSDRWRNQGVQRHQRGVKFPGNKGAFKVTVGLFAREETEPESSLGLQ